MLQETLIALVLIIAGISLLRLFYWAIKVQWPVNYITLAGSADLIARRSVWKYLTFTILPIYVVAVMMSVTAVRESTSGMAVAISIGIFHTLSNHGIRLGRSFKRRRSGFFGRPSTWVDLILISLGCIAGFLAGLGLPRWLYFTIPPPDEFFKALWTTVFVAIIGVLMVDRYKSPSAVSDVASISMSEVSSDLQDYAFAKAREFDTESRLVFAVLFTENLQRPRWLRTLERAKGFVSKSGTYGIMQVTAQGPISDEQSIDIAISSYLRGKSVPYDGRYPDRDVLTEIFSEYNPNPSFVSAAVEMYEHLASENLY